MPPARSTSTSAAMREAMNDTAATGCRRNTRIPKVRTGCRAGSAARAPTMDEAKVLEEAELAERARKRAERDAKSHR